ncbi:MAG: hypothetical protein CMG07_05805 [Candidatus Marinimicrobia bacterium]|nr:hypothetical protein [Candidatus Neomarinimicrobiota bacterium]|tara:strand:- start:1650 stop:3338 length:1689 start_codon:yes stop_codon:yes gene_type:complete
MFVLLLLFFTLSFSEVAFTLNGNTFSQQSFFNKIPREEWNNFSNSQKNDLIKDFIYKELVFLESEKTNFLYDPLIKSKLDNRINQFLINSAYDLFVAFPLVDSLEYSKALKYLKKDIRVRHILIGYKDCRLPIPIKRSKTKALTLSKNLYNDLKSGSNFNDYVVEYSDDPSADKNFGDLGWLSWGRTVPEFQNAAFSLSINTFSEPILTDFGFHIIFLDDIKPSNSSFLDSSAYKALALEKTIMSIPLDIKRVSAKQYDQAAIFNSGLVFNETLLLKVFNHIQNENTKNKIVASGKKNLVNTLNSFNNSGVLCVFDSSAYGVKWFSNHFKNFPATRIPSIKTLEDLKRSFSLAVLQNLCLVKINQEYDNFSFLLDLKIKNITKNLIFDSFIKNHINNVKNIDSTEIINYYNNNKDDKYKEYNLVSVREIKTLDKSSCDSLYSLLQNDFSFLNLAKNNSLTNPRNGGLIEPFTINRYGPMGKKAFSMKINTFSEPIENLDGTWSLIFLEKKINEQYIPLNRVINKIKNFLKKDSQKIAKENLYISLYNKYDVSINPLFFKSDK